MKFLDLRKPLLAFLAFINLLVIFLVIVGLKGLHERTVREAEIRCQNIALAVDLRLSSEISKIDFSLRTVATELNHYLLTGKGERDLLTRALIARQKATLPEAEAWSITNSQGQITFHEGSGPLPSFSVEDRDYFRHLQSSHTPGLAVSKPLKSRLTGNWVVMLARAILNSDGHFAGVLAVPVPVKSLYDMLSGFELGRRGVITLRDIDLKLITRYSERPGNYQVAIGDADMSSQLTSLLSSGQQQAIFRALDPADGVDRFFCLHSLNNAPIHVLVGISKEDFLEEWNVTAWQISGVVLLLLILFDAAVVLFHRQWTLQRETSTALRDGNARLETSLRQLTERDNALVAAQEAGLLGTYSLNIATASWTCSQQMDSILGIDASYPHTVEGWRQLLHPDDKNWMIRYLSTEVFEKRGVFDQEYRIIRPCDGRTVWVHGLGRLDFDQSGNPTCMSGTIQDVSYRRSSEERLHLAQEVFLNTTEGIVIADCHGHILEANPAFTRITGFSAEEAKDAKSSFLGTGAEGTDTYTTVWQVLRTTGHWEGELTGFRKNGTSYVQHTRIFSIYDVRGNIVRLAAIISDVTQFNENRQRLERLAYFDALTGLPNRALLADKMRQAITEHKLHHSGLLVICCIDLDGFKDVNDRLGHDIGDKLLVEVAQRLSRYAEPRGTVARLGGDEFAVFFCGIESEHEVISSVNRLLETSTEGYTAGNYRSEMTLSIGVSTYPNGDTDEPDALLRQADYAMYEAKRLGKNRMCLFDIESERNRRHQQTLHDRLIEALTKEEFRLHYQPKVDLRSGAVAGVEALLRWQHPERGLVLPGDFLWAIETTEATLPLGQWIMREALRQQQQWQAQGLSITMSINVFGLHLQRRDFVARLESLLREYHDIDPRTIELEVVETTALANLDEVTLRIRDCKKLGVGFALDDFGTGYSSLTYLRQLPVDQVKIDRSFVRDMLHNPDDQSLVRSIVGMAHTQGRKVVAEGVETIEHGTMLIHCGCDCAQGFGIARPMESGDVSVWISRWTKPEIWNDIDSNLSDSRPLL